MSDALGQRLLEALLESWDRNNTILLNLLCALPEGGLEAKAMDCSPSVSEMFTHIHHERMVSVFENAPEFAGNVPEEEWMVERDPDRIAQMLKDSAKRVRDAVKSRVETGRNLDLHFDHPILLLQLLIFHEGYHHGQIKLALKVAGRPVTDSVLLMKLADCESKRETHWTIVAHNSITFPSRSALLVSFSPSFSLLVTASIWSAVFDTVGGDTYVRSFKALKRGGRLVSMLEQPCQALMQDQGVQPVGFRADLAAFVHQSHIVREQEWRALIAEHRRRERPRHLAHVLPRFIRLRDGDIGLTGRPRLILPLGANYKEYDMRYEPEKWKSAYQDDGFVIVQDLLDPSTLSALLDGMDKITGDPQDLPPHLKEKIFLERDHVKNNPQWYTGALTPEECGNSVRQIADLALFDPVFAGLICYPPLLDVLEVLFDSAEFSFTLLVGKPKAARVGNGVRNGGFHRDTPDQGYTSANVIQAFLCLDAMTIENGPTLLIRGSHQVSDQEAQEPRSADVGMDRLKLEDKVAACCPAGSGLFFTSKVIHAAGHNRSEYPRRTINMEWAGPEVLTTSPIRYPYQGLRPRSKDPVHQKQIRMTFPKLFADD